MCLQCATNSKDVCQILPGVTLSVATISHGDVWKEGQYALIRSNDPDFIIVGEPVYSPLNDLEDDEYDTMYDDVSYRTLDNTFMEWRDKNPLHTDLNTAYYYVRAAVSAGYDPDEDGSCTYWILHRIAKYLAKGIL